MVDEYIESLEQMYSPALWDLMGLDDVDVVLSCAEAICTGLCGEGTLEDLLRIRARLEQCDPEQSRWSRRLLGDMALRLIGGLISGWIIALSEEQRRAKLAGIGVSPEIAV